MSCLIDTDHIISGLANHPPAILLLRSLRPAGLAVSTITLGEVFEGAYRAADPSAQLSQYHLFLAGFAVLNVTAAVADIFAERRAGLRAGGNLIADLDLLIAATALAHDLTLVTRNRRHFERVLGLRRLTTV